MKTKTFILRNRQILDNAVRFMTPLLNDDRAHPIYECVVREHKSSRSLSQNRLYWKWLTVIGDEIGYLKEEMHEIFADKFLPPVVVEYGGQIIKSNRSTTKLTVKEFTDYLNKIEIFCATDVNIMLPHPEELYMKAMGL